MSEADVNVVAGEHFSRDGDSVALTVARCARCDATVFPVQPTCPRCTADDMVAESLPDQGTLWSFTIQRFQPKAPFDGAGDAHFRPYGVGYVQFGDRVIVEGRLTENDPDRLRIGQAMKVVLQPHAVDESGTAVVTFGFQPMD